MREGSASGRWRRRVPGLAREVVALGRRRRRLELARIAEIERDGALGAGGDDAKGEGGDSEVEANVKQKVHALTDRFPIYG